MLYLVPLSNAPKEDKLSPDDVRSLKAHFTVTNYEVQVDGQGIEWGNIEEIEVAKAARAQGPAGWLVKKAVFGGSERYHVGIYSGRNELVLPNLTLESATYVVQTLAYYARNRIPYKGPEGFTTTVEA